MDCAIVMCDVTNKLSSKHVPTWIADLRRHTPALPIVLVANKIDAADARQFGALNAQLVALQNAHNLLAVCSVSAKRRQNLAAPFAAFAAHFVEAELV